MNNAKGRPHKSQRPQSFRATNVVNGLLQFRHEARRALNLEKLLWLNRSLSQNRAERTFRHITRVIRDGGVAIGPRVEPDFVASRRLAVKFEAVGL